MVIVQDNGLFNQLPTLYDLMKCQVQHSRISAYNDRFVIVTFSLDNMSFSIQSKKLESSNL